MSRPLPDYYRWPTPIDEAIRHASDARIRYCVIASTDAWHGPAIRATPEYSLARIVRNRIRMALHTGRDRNPLAVY